MLNPPGCFIRKRRTDLGLTLRTCGARLGVHFTLVGMWERGEEPVPRRFQDPLAGLLRVPAAELAGRWDPIPLLDSQETPDFPAYPIKGSVEEMRALGRLAVTMYDRALHRHSLGVHDEMRDRFPRDSPVELLGAYDLLARGAVLQFRRLLHLGFRRFVIQRKTQRYIGDLARHALFLAGPGYTLLAVPQVSVWVGVQKRERRMDFLVYFQCGKGPGIWIDVEIDGRDHDDQEEEDDQRAWGLHVYTLRYRAQAVRDGLFVERLVRDAHRLVQEYGPPPASERGKAA